MDIVGHTVQVSYSCTTNLPFCTKSTIKSTIWLILVAFFGSNFHFVIQNPCNSIFLKINGPTGICNGCLDMPPYDTNLPFSARQVLK
uniref:Uncharacterized protein n=1 Tax=Romanomermis culicivorax TaxID=13658 RepID=A0A915HP11_ROMCU